MKTLTDPDTRITLRAAAREAAAEKVAELRDWRRQRAEAAQVCAAARAKDLRSQPVQFRYEETQTASAGQSGDLEIPAVFTLALRPFEGSDPVEVIARFRYRINGGHLKLSYALLNPTEIARQAFLDHVDAVRSNVECPVFQGRPE